MQKDLAEEQKKVENITKNSVTIQSEMKKRLNEKEVRFGTCHLFLCVLIHGVQSQVFDAQKWVQEHMEKEKVRVAS